MNKLLIFSILFIVVIFVTGCAMKKSADTEATNVANQNNVDYIVTTDIPKTATPSEKKDTAEPGYVPIHPNYDQQQIPKTKGKIEWFKTGLGSRIPAFPEGKLLEVINTDKQFVAYIANINEKIFSDYFQSLYANGYIGEINNWEGFTLISPEIAINLRYMQEPGGVTTIRARLLKNADEYDKLKEKMTNKEENK